MPNLPPCKFCGYQPVGETKNQQIADQFRHERVEHLGKPEFVKRERPK